MQNIPKFSLMYVNAKEFCTKVLVILGGIQLDVLFKCNITVTCVRPGRYKITDARIYLL